MLKKGSVLLTAFEEYTVKEQIGLGGNGTVFLVVSSDNEPFAIKAIDKNVTRKDKIRRFKNEVNFCQKYSHPNIINVVDYGAYKNSKLDCIFYVMPFYNSTLRKEIEKGVDSKKVVTIFNQLLAGMEFAHQKNVWHRDMKPENILYDTNNQLAVIADFGIAHFCEDDIITAIETKVEERLANYMYAAPEQRIKGHYVDGRADVFALGLILNEMFTNTVISGSNFKKIADCCKEYGFFDQVVDILISQDPNNRLFPVRKILIEISTLLKIESDKAELKRIIEKQINENAEEDPLFDPPVVMDIKYENNQLVFYLDKKTNSTWDNILISGQYSHSSAGGYPTHSFSSRYDENKDCTTFSVIVRLQDDNYINSIVDFFKSWLPIVTFEYSQKEKQRRADIIRQEIEKREQEIKAKESEMKIREQLKFLI